MEGLKLSDQEQRFYGELFQGCDTDVSGKISGIKALELFRASGLSQEALHQITELCGAKRLGHFGRSQFYIALKLIAVGQAGLPIKLDSLNTGVDIALPKFGKVNEQGERRWLSEQESGGVTADGKGGSGPAGQLPPPPQAKKSHTRSLSGQYRGVVTDGQPQQVNAQQTQVSNREESNESKSPPFSPKQSPPASPPGPRRQLLKQQTVPAGYPTVTVAPPLNVKMATGSLDGGHINPVALSGAYQNSAGENGNWALFEDEDSHMLLGAGVKKWDHLEPPGFDSSSISSEAESVDDIWAITEEQREYYVKQFKTMQPDLGGVITGKVAKDFFEKSKLPVTELSKIWQLSDLNRDGALSLEEFCIAMHLVVLRRNEIELPERLPLSLMPYATLSDEPFASDLPPGSTMKRMTPPSPQANQWTASFVQESPGSSGVPSPALLPVNFEFAKPNAADPVSIVSQDSKIIHPVAVRMSPDGHPIAPEGFDRGRALSDPGSHECALPDSPDPVTPTKQRSNTESFPDSSQTDHSAKYSTPLHGRPRPIAKKQNQVPMVVRGQIQPPPLTSQDISGVPDRPNALLSTSLGGESALVNSEPPAPPPRPPGTHGRSMSVDLKPKTEGGHYSGLLPPPAVPPRVSPKDAPSWKANEISSFPGTEGADKSVSFNDVRSQDCTVANELISAPQVLTKSVRERHRRSFSLDYKKVVPKDTVDGSGDFSSTASSSLTVAVENKPSSPRDQQGAGEEAEKPQHPVLTLRQASRDKRELLMAVRTHKERNAMLTRLNCELNQELQEVMEQRIALEIQLEHLRPFSS